MTYKQLAQEQRYQIYTLLKIEESETEIASFLGVHRSTINRELKRNKGKKGCRPKQAHEMAVGRIKRNNNRIKAEEWEAVRERIEFDMSPEQISNDLKKEKIKISHESIYQYIYADKRNGGTLHTHLRCQKSIENAQEAMIEEEKYLMQSV